MKNRLRTVHKTVTRTKYLLIATLFATLQIFSFMSTILPTKASAAGTVTTNPATNITDKTATLNGTIQGSTNATGRGFEYGTTESFGTELSEPQYGFASQIGTARLASGQFDDPTDIATDASGNVYVVDNRNNRIQKFDSNGTFITKWGEDILYYPTSIGLDSSNNVYVVDSSEHIFKFNDSGNLITSWGESGSGDGQISDAYGLSVDTDSNVYVADTNNNRIQKFDSSGNFIAKWGSQGEGDGQFDNPMGLANDLSGNIFVVDRLNNRIQKFDSNGNFITKWGGNGDGYRGGGSADGQFFDPNGIATDISGNVYVADSQNNRIQKFDSNGTFITKWGSEGRANDQFLYPSGITIDTNGNTYVTDGGLDRIQKFDSNGNFIDIGQIYRFDDGQFNYPSHVTTDSSGNIFVSDMGNNRIQKFSSSGQYLSQFGSAGSGDGQFDLTRGIVVDSTGNIYVVDEANRRIQKFDSSGNFITKWGEDGSGDGQFSQPNAIAADASGNIYVADKYNHRIQKFSSSGQYLSQFGSQGSADGQFNDPYGVATDSNDNIYVADYYNNRVQKFDPSGNFITKWGEEGEGEGQFSQLTGVSVDSANNVYVVDAGNFRIQKFNNSGQYITQWGSRDTEGNELGNGTFGWQLMSLTVDSDGNVFVADGGNNVIQKFTPIVYPNDDFTSNITGLKCDTNYYYRAYIYEDNIKINGSTQSFSTDSLCTGPDLKLSVKLDNPGLIEGQDGSYTFTFKNIGTGPMLPFIQTFFTLPPNVQIDGNIIHDSGVLDVTIDEENGFGLLTIFDPARWDGGGDPFSATPLNPGESYSFTIPVSVVGPVDETSSMRVAALDYLALVFGFGEPEFEGLPYEAESLELAEALFFIDSDPSPENIDALFGISSNNIAIYSGIMPGSSDQGDAEEPETDSDPISDSVENASPNNGDGNNDGTPDSEQANVTSLPIPSGSNQGSYITLVTPSGTTITTTAIEQATSLATQDSSFDYPLGLISFTATDLSPGSTIPIELYYYTDQSPDTFTPRKYNPTTTAYTTLSTQTTTTLTQTTINTTKALKLTYQITDGGDLDQDNTTNGTIVDPVGLAQTKTTAPDTGLQTHWLLGVKGYE